MTRLLLRIGGTASALLSGLFALSACTLVTHLSASPTVTVTTPAENDAIPTTALAAEPAAPESTGPGIPMVGEPAENYGVRLTVVSATAAETISRNLTYYGQGSGFEEFTDVAAPAGGRYIVVEAIVENLGKESMDLTCGWPINIKALDEKSREFDTVDDLYEIEGNPECNAGLQPGFSSNITYAFVVPKESKIKGISFQDSNYYGEDYEVVSFKPAL